MVLPFVFAGASHATTADALLANAETDVGASGGAAALAGVAPTTIGMTALTTKHAIAAMLRNESAIALLTAEP